MGALDPVLVDVATQVGISKGRTASLLSALLSGITEMPGGLAGFLDRFRQVGRVEFTSSWLGGSLRPISGSEVEAALGHEWIEKVAKRAMLALPKASSALALMLPPLIQRLTPGGHVPSRLPSDILEYLQRVESPVRAKPRQPRSMVDANKGQTSAIPRWLWPF